MLLLLGIMLATRLYYAHIPFERDEGEYAYAGSLLLHGHLPFKEAYNMKFPGSYFMYALLMKVGGENIAAVRVGVTLVVLLTAFLTGCVVYLFTCKTEASVLAATVFFALNNTIGGEGLMANAEHFVNLFAVAGFLSLVYYLKKQGGFIWIFLSGFCMGLAVIMKQYGYAFGLLAFLLLLNDVRQLGLVRAVRVLLVFIIGGCLPLLMLLAWVLTNSLWDKFYFLTIKYAFAYAHLGAGNLGTTLHSIFVAALPVWISAWLSIIVMLLFLRDIKVRIILAWIIFSILAFATGFYLRIHYFILLYPAIAAACGYAWYTIAVRLNKGLYAMGLTLLLLMAFIVSYPEQHFGVNPNADFDRHYPWSLFSDMPAIAKRADELAAPGDKLSLFANEPEIYFYAHRIAASGYMYNYPFFEPQPYAADMMHDFIRAVEANPSKLFVYYTGSLDTDGATYPEFKNWWNNYSKGFVIKEVYAVYGDESRHFIGEQNLTTDTTWKKGSIRAEFWIRK